MPMILRTRHGGIVKGEPMRGGAGFGAEEIARRAAEKEARLEAELAGLRQWKAKWEAGAEGERAVGAALDGLFATGWRVVHDVHWPGRPKANLDHVAVGPGGIVIVDAKNWSGSITVNQGVVRQNGYRRERLPEEAASAAAALTVLLEPQHRAAVRSAVCFVQQQIGPALLPGGTAVVGLQQLAGWLVTLPVVLGPGEVHVIHDYLARTLGGPRSPVVHTTAALSNISGLGVHEPSAAARSRARRRGPARPPRASSTTRRPTSRSAARSRQGSGLAGVLKLLFALFVIMVSLNVLKGLTSTAPTVPPPAPPATVEAGTIPGAPPTVPTTP